MLLTLNARNSRSTRAMKADITYQVNSAKRSVNVRRLSALAKTAYADEKFDVVLDLSSKLLEAEPDNFIALRLNARIHTQRGAVDLAEHFWRRLYATAPDKVEPALSLARIAYSRGDWDAMAEFADRAALESGERADALRLAITARVKAKQGDELPEMLLRFYYADPDRFVSLLKTLSGPELAQAQAAVLVRLCAGKPVASSLASLVEECRKSWEVGASRAESRKDDEVRASYLRAIWSIDPGSREAIDGLNALSRERLKFLRMAIKHGHDEVALQQAEAVAKFNPTSFEAWLAIARLSAPNDPSRSAECFRTCAEMKPDEVYYRFRQGLALIKSDQLAQAILAFRSVLEGAGDGANPVATAAQMEIARLGRTVFSRAIDAAKAGQLGDARAGYIAATVSSSSGGGDIPTAALAMFWAYMSAAQVMTALALLGRSAVTLWKQAKTRSARLKRRVITHAATSARSTR